MSLTDTSLNHSLPDFNIARTLGLTNSPNFDFQALANKLDCTRNFNQVGIVYDDGNHRWLVRPSRKYANSNQSTVTHVIITKVNIQSPDNASKAITNTLNAPSLANELTSTAFACGAALVTICLTLGATAAIPLTGGGSGLIAGIIAAGGVATGLQCTIGAGRLITMASGNENGVAWLDSQEWYTATSTALDIISLAGAGAGLTKTVEVYRMMKASSSAKILDWLKGLNRTERKRITEEIIRAQNPGISNSGIKAALKAGFYPKRFPSEALQHSLQRELTAALANTSAFVGSALTGTIRNPNNIRESEKYIVGLIQSFSFLDNN